MCQSHPVCRAGGPVSEVVHLCLEPGPEPCSTLWLAAAPQQQSNSRLAVCTLLFPGKMSSSGDGCQRLCCLCCEASTTSIGSVRECLCLRKLILGSPLVGTSHLCLPAAQGAICWSGIMLYICASIYMVEWYYNAQQARGLTQKVLACFAMTAVLASAGIMVADLGHRVWPMLSAAEASQAVSFCLTWCTASLPPQECPPLGRIWPVVHWRNPA